MTARPRRSLPAVATTGGAGPVARIGPGGGPGIGPAIARAIAAAIARGGARGGGPRGREQAREGGRSPGIVAAPQSARRDLGTRRKGLQMFKFLGGAIGFIFLIGLIVVIGLLALIF